MDVHQELADLRASLASVADRIEAFEAEVGAVEPGFSGPTPGAAENRTIGAAGARLAQQRAREMRAGLDRLRAQAARMASEARATRARVVRDTRPRTPGPDEAVVVVPTADAREPAHELAAAETRDEVLARLVLGAVRTVPGARWAGVCSRTHDGALRAEVISDPVVAELVASGVHGLLVHWIAGPRVRRPLALVVCADAPEVLDESSERAAQVLADHALIALAGVDRAGVRSSAAGGQDVVRYAQGILVARHGLDEREALDRLLRAAENANTRLVDVASWVVGNALGGDVLRREGRP